MDVDVGYRGRFAPTPSGPLHLGSLCTALASWLDARAVGGRWLLRIDDLDPQRCRREHADTILRQLEAHSLTWDESPRWQSAHLAEYQQALHRLQAAGWLYRCTCSRARLAQIQRSGPDGPVYPGACRGANRSGPGALRFRLDADELSFEDRLLGWQRRRAHSEVGDFVVWRRDGVPGYQLTCAVDEHAQRITRVVRGADLLGSTFRQRAVARALALPALEYAHLPVLCTADGGKLSKQNRAPAVDARRAADNLRRCLLALGQPAPPYLDVPGTLRWAQSHWSPSQVPRQATVIVEPLGGDHPRSLASLPQCNNGG